MGTIIVGAILLTIVVGAIVYSVKNRSKCAGCGAKCHCEDKGHCAK